MEKYNNYKNEENTDINDLDAILLILADADKEIKLYAIGGTAMVLGNLKETTKDIDFLTNTPHNEIQEILSKAGFIEKQASQVCNIWYYKNKIRLDFFYSGFILGITLPNDWEKISTHVKNIGKIKLYILNWYDIIITKLARSENRDIEDILIILKNKKADFNMLKKRYYDIAETAIIGNYDYKFQYLEMKWHQQN